MGKLNTDKYNMDTGIKIQHRHRYNTYTGKNNTGTGKNNTDTGR